MKITKLEVHILRAPDTGRPHWVSHFIVPRANEILVRVHTDEGIEGIVAVRLNGLMSRFAERKQG